VPGVATPTVEDRGEAAGDPRAIALARRIGDLGRADGHQEARLESIALSLVDAMLAGDAGALRVALEGLREARTVALAAGNETLLGWLAATVAFSNWGVERLGPDATQNEIAEGTHAWRFVRALERSPLGSGELRELLEVDETEISRTGHRLLEAGLVRRSKVGRHVLWELAPRARRILRPTPAPVPRVPQGERPEARPGGVGADFWMAAIRQGFEGAAGDEPAVGRRTVDPTRERIVDCTLALHRAQGISETSFEDVATKVGVPVETIESYFPTVDDLVKGCGQHVLTSLRLPPPERAGEIFTGASSEQERLRRLIETLFDVYEREAESLQRGRHARADVPLIDEALAQVDASVDALVAEALRPLDPNAETIASVRALTDLEVWRALREAGASASASVDDASEAVDGWLGQRTRLRAPPA
jgi:AcrR family transcriptional regulator/DNA-binding transcriptional ArsR family regulator